MITRCEQDKEEAFAVERWFCLAAPRRLPGGEISVVVAQLVRPSVWASLGMNSHPG